MREIKVTREVLLESMVRAFTSGLDAYLHADQLDLERVQSMRSGMRECESALEDCVRISRHGALKINVAGVVANWDEGYEKAYRTALEAIELGMRATGITQYRLGKEKAENVLDLIRERVTDGSGEYDFGVRTRFRVELHTRGDSVFAVIDKGGGVRLPYSWLIAPHDNAFSCADEITYAIRRLLEGTDGKAEGDEAD